ncbi:UDP-galactopyranose mutase [Jeongeupia wiesaeckerbachi]|uniref:UDP-galactopyranose mutase n=1 Tax=Jeongeupia wiesaeckerbachi TaxID=3051218 RepID=UPI003D803E46
MKYDAIVIGSGFAGSIIAERLANILNKKVLIIEQRDHIAGNMFDYKDGLGINIHKYGPHLFRTNEDFVVEYLSQFTDWYPYQHKVLAHIDGHLVPVPFNLDSIKILLPDQAENLIQVLTSEFGMDIKVPVSKLRNNANESLAWLGDYIFNKVYLNYTTKQWGEKPENLDFETITARVPVHVSYDDRYFQERYQQLPKNGYTGMFENMLRSENINVLLNTKAKQRLRLDRADCKIYFEDEAFDGPVIYTGALDELFEYSLGELPYRSLRFTVEERDVDFFQPTGTVNYPNEHAYTRISEYKHMMLDRSMAGTSIMFEYPQEYDRNDPEKDIPYYPIPKEDNQQAYEGYVDMARDFPNLFLLGRLAEYRYYDMNNIIQRSLAAFDEWFKDA